jgi:hypothetical protein
MIRISNSAITAGFNNQNGSWELLQTAGGCNLLHRPGFPFDLTVDDQAFPSDNRRVVAEHEVSNDGRSCSLV